MEKNKSVEEYISKNNHWSGELGILRKILCSTELLETVKWGAPVYTYKGKNIVGIGAFKGYFGLWFFQGALLSDKEKKLINAQEGVTKALRQWRFNSVDEIDKKLIITYINESVENHKNGNTIKPSPKKPLQIPSELSFELSRDQKLKNSFDEISLSKQREFCEHISGAKREATKLKRLEKILPLILEKKGLYDKYKNC